MNPHDFTGQAPAPAPGDDSAPAASGAELLGLEAEEESERLAQARLASAVREALAPREELLGHDAAGAFAPMHDRLMEAIDLSRRDAQLAAASAHPPVAAPTDEPTDEPASSAGLARSDVAPWSSGTMQVLAKAGGSRGGRAAAITRSMWAPRASAWARCAAAACVLAAGVLGGHRAGRGSRPGALPVQSLLDDYSSGLGMGTRLEVSARSEGDTSRWLSQRMGRPVSLPSGRRLGAMLLGARRCTVEGRPSAQAHYLKDGVRVALYQIHAPHLGLAELGEVQARGRSYFTQQLGGCSLIAWRADEDIMAVVSPLEMPASLSLALSMRESTPALSARPHAAASRG